MSDPTFIALVARCPWIVDPDPYSYVDPGWAGLFEEALRRVGELVASHPGAEIHGLQVKEKFGELRVGASTILPPDIEGEVRRVWRETELRSVGVCQLCGRPGRRRSERRVWETTCDVHARR